MLAAGGLDTVPVFRGEALYFVRGTLLDKRAACRDIISPAYVEEILRQHCEQRVNHRLLIWSFLCFEWWCRIFLDGQKPELVR